LEAAVELQHFCSAQNYRFCFIGGIAVQKWGEPRVTGGADIILVTGFGNELNFVTALTRKFRARRPDAAQFALRTRVLLLEASNGVPLNVAFGGLPFEERVVNRASSWRISRGISLVTCGVDDLIVYKAFANRAQDWADIERILMRQIECLNTDLIFEELRPLLQLKEVSEADMRLRKMIDEERSAL
jgi:hypothetical protein